MSELRRTGGGGGGERLDRPRLIVLLTPMHNSQPPRRPLDIFWIGRKRAHQFAHSVAIDVEVSGTLVVRHRGSDVPFPRSGGGLGVLEPPGLFAGKVDYDQVGPAVAIDVVGEVAKAVAVAVRIVFFGLFGDDAHLPVGSGVVDAAGRKVGPPIVIEIADGRPFATEFGVELRAPEADFLLCWLSGIE